MGASLIEIKRRIASTKKTSQITNAMQMVSGAKLAKSEIASRQFQEYAKKVREMVTHLAASDIEEIDEGYHQADLYHDMLVPRKVKKTGYLVITSDKGLAGSYNSSVCKHVLEMLERDHQDPSEYIFMTIGGTGADFFRGRGLNIVYELRELSDQPNFDEVRKIVNMAVQMYDQHVFD